MIQFNTREDFLNSRIGKIGASDAPIIMEVSPYTTPYQLGRIKLGLDKPKEMLPHMQEGLDIEDEARNYFYKRTGIKVNPWQVNHPNINYLIASLDGIDLNGETILEIKRPSLEDHEYVKKYKKPPKKYFPQLQHQLECTSLNHVFYLSFYKDDPVLIENERDSDYIKTLLGKEAEFYKYMTDLTLPPLIDRDYVLKDDEEWIKETVLYLNYQNKLSTLEKEMENSKNRLIAMANGNNCKGNGISLRKTIRKGKVDYSSIPELKTVNLEKYRKGYSEYYRVIA